MTYEEWLCEVDIIMVRNFGVDHRDLPDANYALAHERGCEPIDFVRENASDITFGMFSYEDVK